jgi:tRNA-dihydrouridine synthase
MAELSHRALRELIEGFGGCDEYFTEMISAGALLGGGQFESFYIDALPCPERVVYQLVGSDAGQIVRAAALLDPYPSAGIDLNMGCSAPSITRTGAGVRWMASIDQAASLAARVRAVTRRRLSVKLRTGLEDDFEYLAAFCRRLEAEGVERITLHPRTAREKFRRLARWEYVGRLRVELGIPVAGNGDIGSAAELAARAASGICDAVMAGRAAVRQPWIFAWAKAAADRIPTGRYIETVPAATCAASSAFAEEDAAAADHIPTGRYIETVPAPAFAKSPAKAEGSFSVSVEETGLRFLELLARYQPGEFHLSRARRFFSYFCDNLVWGNYLKTLLNRESGLAGIEGVWTTYFREHPEEREIPGGVTG